jgi:hypothetical protein
MHFKIRYFRNGKLLGDMPWAGSLIVATKIARDGLAVHNADFVIVLDETGEEAARCYA